MTATEDDAVDRVLASIHSLDWDNSAHREALGHEIERRARRSGRSRRPRLAIVAVATLLVLGGLAVAAEGPLRKWLSVRVDAVEKDDAGKIESITLRTEGGSRAQLVPIEKSPGAFNPAIDENAPAISVPTRDGRIARIRILRRGRDWHEVFYKALEAASQPALGDRFTVQAVHLSGMTLARRDDVLEIRHTFEDGQVLDFVLHALPDDPRRFSDGETLVELMTP